jgi:hypothetical protein
MFMGKTPHGVKLPFRLNCRVDEHSGRPCCNVRWRPIFCDRRYIRNIMLGTILIVLLILMLVGALPNWSHSRNWGYGPTGGLGFVLLIVVILLLLGRI